ncbi:hypothetical protein LTR27_002462 [Elasticomyces elasticus]|nr:hypothetical protein LTR27_002462 [Elasticomyces elasticus]
MGRDSVTESSRSWDTSGPDKCRRNRRVLLFDCERENWEVLHEQDIREERANGAKLKELYLPPARKEIALFVDADTQTDFSTNQDNHGRSTVLLSKLYMDRLGPLNNFWRRLGGLRTIYVRNFESLSDW